MKRRNLIKAVTMAGGLVSLGGAVIWLKAGSRAAVLNWDTTLLMLNKLTTKKLISTGQWLPNEIFNHLAQSVEFSMIGYPEHRSAAFKSLIGKPAFSAFSYRGEMMHSLHEPIPGAVELDFFDTNESILRLIKSLLNFDVFSGELQPHFAYGELAKEEYRLAHIMHINNHLTEIVIK